MQSNKDKSPTENIGQAIGFKSDREMFEFIERIVTIELNRIYRGLLGPDDMLGIVLLAVVLAVTSNRYTFDPELHDTRDRLFKYVRGIVKLQTRNHARKKQIQNEHLAKLAAQHPEDAKSAAELLAAADLQGDLRDALIEAIDKLSPEQRHVLYLRVYTDMKWSGIGDMLDMNHDTVRSIYHRAIQQIREDLRGQFPDDFE